MTPHHCIGCENCIQDGISSKRPRCKITRWFLDMYDVQDMIATIGCKHDTRKAPAPAAPQYFRPTGCVGVCAVMPERIPELKASIRNQTLDEMRDKIEARIRGIHDAYTGETNSKMYERAFTMADGMSECKLMIESLRTPSPQEQP